MKNLKKVLSLALAFAMVLGLCVGAMAAGTQDVTTLKDWDTVKHQSAAKLLNAFNIMAGDDKGNFRPTDPVTRAEAVKMICVALWGGDDLKDLFKDGTTTFTDVSKDAWYAGYVKYAATAEIVAGRNATTFDPKGNVTGTELLKMALIALNYNSEVEGLTGTGWDLRTMRLATDPTVKNLTDGLSEITNWNAPLTRDQAAQIIANMILHEYVTYNLQQNGQIGNIKSYEKGTFGSWILGMKEEHGTLVANAYANLSATSYDTTGKAATGASAYTINDKRSTNNVVVRVATKSNETTTYSNKEATLESTLADIGRPVTLYSKDSVLVAATLDPWTEVEAEWNASYSEITNYEGNNTATTIPTFTHSESGTAITDYDYVVTKYYDTNGNGLIDIVTNTCYGNATKVGNVVASKTYGNVYEVNNITWRSSYETAAVNHNNFIVESEANFTAKKDDIIAYRSQTNAFGKWATYGVVLDSVAGTVSRVVDNAATYTHTVTIDGVVYDVAKSKVGTISFGTAGTFFLYPDEQVGFVKANEAPATHYGVIYDAGYAASGTGTAIGDRQGAIVQVCAILDDGTSGVYNVNSVKIDTNVIKTSALSYADMTAATVTVKINGTNVSVPGFFHNDTGALYAVDNDVTSKKNELITYTVEEDGSLNIAIVSGAPEIAADTATGVGSPSFGSKYFTGKSLTFMQTVTDGKDEAWVVATGLPTSAYTVKTGAVVYTENLFSSNATADSNKIVALVMDLAHNGGATAVKTEFVYVVADNGIVGYKDGAYVHEISLYSSATDSIATVNVNSTFEVGKFYASYNDVTGFGSPISPDDKAGFITSFADNVIGLTRVTKGADKVDADTLKIETKTEAYVVGKDTRYYLIDGTKTTEISASEVGTQGIMDWTKTTNTANSSVKYTEYYQAFVRVKENTNEALQVILFAKEQKFTADPTVTVAP